MKFKKHEAKRVFEHANFGVVGEIIFEIQRLHAADDIFSVTGFLQNLTRLLRVKLF